MIKISKQVSSKSMLLLISFSCMMIPAIAQVDSVIVVKPDSTNIANTDTIKTAPADTTAQTKEKKKKKNEFIIYGGGNLNQLYTSSDVFDANSSAGYHVGLAYKRGSFFYWQVGARYNNAQYNFVDRASSRDSGKLTVSAIDIPITGGINFLSFVNRLIAVRAFVSAVPSFNIGVGDNNLKISEDNINSFVFYGQVGIGVNITFVLLELGYNYGFQDMLKDYSSNPGQAFISIGFRF